MDKANSVVLRRHASGNGDLLAGPAGIGVDSSAGRMASPWKLRSQIFRGKSQSQGRAAIYTAGKKGSWAALRRIGTAPTRG